MAPKRKGLGRGLDGLFTAYDEDKPAVSKTDSSGSKKKKAASKAENADVKAQKTEKTSTTKAQKPEKSEKTGNAGKTGKAGKAGRARATESAGTSGRVGATGKAGTGRAAAGKAVSDESNAETAGTKTARKQRVETGKSSITPEDQAVVNVRITDVEPNREQPRKDFREEGLEELAESIRQFGVISPLLVQKREDHLEIIAGERRWRAARLAGLKEIPVIIKDYTEQEIVEVSLIENIQREDLNPIEEAKAYQRLLQEFSLRQEDVAKRVSKNRTTITNSLRLLKLDEQVQSLLMDGSLTTGHARALIGIEDPAMQREVASRVVEEKLSVRDIEKLMRSMIASAKKTTSSRAYDEAYLLALQDMEEKLKASLGTRVTVSSRNKKAGKIQIEYYSREELERLYELLRSLGNGVGGVIG